MLYLRLTAPPEHYSERFVGPKPKNTLEVESMKNPLDSLWGTIISGLVLLVILYVFVVNFLH